MKFVAVRCHRTPCVWLTHPGRGSATPLNSHAACGFAQTLRRLLYLRCGLRTIFSPILCINGTNVIEGNLLARPVTRFAVAERICDAKCRQHRKISSVHAMADEPAKSLVN